MRGKTYFLSLGLAFLWHGSATAWECNYSISASNVTIAWSTSFEVQEIQITLNKGVQHRCEYALTFTQGGGSSYTNRRMIQGASTLKYQLYKDSALTQILKDYPDLSSTGNYFTGSMGGGVSTRTFTYYVQIPLTEATTPTYRPSGNFQDTFTIKAYEGRNSIDFSAGAAATASVQLSANVPKIIDLSIVPSGGGFDPGSVHQALSFGTLTSGATQSLDLRVRTNAGYQVTMDSSGGGKLTNITRPQQKLSYSTTVNGASYSLTTPTLVASGNGQTGTQGTAQPVTFTIGAIDQVLAGSYQDIITVTVATTE